MLFPVTDDRLLNRSNRHRINAWKNDPAEWRDYGHATKNGTDSERRLLYRAPLELGPGNYAELGTLFGQSAACLLHGCSDSGNDCHAYAVDLFGTGEKHESGFRTTPERLERYRQEKRIQTPITFVTGDSHEAGLAMRGRRLSFRFVFIDADHSYYGCSRDWVVWSSLVEVGGWVAFHDCHDLGVDQTIREIPRGEWEQIYHIYSTKVFRRLV